MGAYASLLSLGHILDQLLQHPPRQRAVLDEAQIHSLLENIIFLQEFLEDFSLIRRDEIVALEAKIVISAYAAEDIIESRVVDLILEDSEAGSERSCSILLCQDLQKVIEEFSSMKKDVMKIEKTEGIEIVQQPTKAATAGSLVRVASNSKNTMVGFDEDLINIMETLTGDESNLQILSIVGMGGIGKTTLAKNVFDNPLIEQHFDLRAWVTISQQYSVREILLGLLKDIGALAGGGEEITQKNDDELGLRLHRSLFDRRYFIVMDDMWSIEVWDAIKRFFPDNNNRSRVMVTSRLSNVADNFFSCTPHQLHLLDEDQSWALFCDKLFGQESCPPELEEVGKKIVRNCRGLPLAIVAISGLLAKTSRTVEYWEYVANHTYAELDNGGDGLCFEVHAYGFRNKIKTCTIHDLLRDLCLREAQKEKFLRVNGLDSQSKIIDKLIIQRSSDEKLCRQQVFDPRNFASCTRSLICWDRELESTSIKLPVCFRLLRVLNMNDFYSCKEILQLVNLRYLYFIHSSNPNLLNPLESLSLQWNLQTIIIAGPLCDSVTPTNLPAEIWEMPQLRHLKMEQGDFNLPDPPSINSKNGRRDILVMKNLQTLYTVRNFRCTDEVVHRMPNLKKLGITYYRFTSGFGWDHYEGYNLSNLHNLESLTFCSYENVLRNLCFPQSLKKLTLKNCRVPWEDLTVVGSLPHLEVLYLMQAVKGREWNPVEGEFLELKSLKIVSTDLVEWTADSSHFPRLEKLILGYLEFLKEIPDGIGEIQTLRSISLVFCSDSANSSAEKIQEEQLELGNYDLQVRIF
ncbi:putative late blight resistance protein homolog R1A-3 [Primulina eburnea]|uniref:putative late blight resistance protein homolog R1A-3 n=1 Tax=Primulina eburnea TaxID=1245227 RepID=UPI003C6C5AF6